MSRIIETLINEFSIDTFYFGSKSEFDTLCLEIVTELKDSFTDYQPKSGTAIAYNYAVKKKKEIVNVFY